MIIIRHGDEIERPDHDTEVVEALLAEVEREDPQFCWNGWKGGTFSTHLPAGINFRFDPHSTTGQLAIDLPAWSVHHHRITLSNEEEQRLLAAIDKHCPKRDMVWHEWACSEAVAVLTLMRKFADERKEFDAKFNAPFIEVEE